MKKVNIVNEKITATFVLIGLLATLVLSNLFLNTMPQVNLLAAYPSIPSWVISYVSGIIGVASAIATITTLLATAGLGAIASVAIAYIRRYGVRAGLSL
ncbi:hypothetical protein [Streptococcus saliviloxodontae]|uniref:Circular bacteriocin, circularin A/uberolysin family n=1 Tax=Streptococcus saliviloxodontae TaxID=1349416 RepID=A0ABS2PNM9_9STRE|nr:hypothetical protein [Streptococcus saliviloxodontae]MBM7637039.1 hypothetical protein [Streptococcus saliviloxodontae]